MFVFNLSYRRPHREAEKDVSRISGGRNRERTHRPTQASAVPAVVFSPQPNGVFREMLLSFVHVTYHHEVFHFLLRRLSFLSLSPAGSLFRLSLLALLLFLRQLGLLFGLAHTGQSTLDLGTRHGRDFTGCCGIRQPPDQVQPYYCRVWGATRARVFVCHTGSVLYRTRNAGWSTNGLYVASDQLSLSITGDLETQI